MKRILIILLVIVPILCFGQSQIENESVNRKGAIKDIKIDKQMLTLDIYKLSTNEIKSCSNSIADALSGYLYNPIPIYSNDSIPTTFRERVTNTDIKPKQWTYMLDREIIPQDSAININPSDIESINILKDLQYTGVYGNAKDTIVITSRKKTEYETIVIAPGYENFLTTQKSKDFYSETYLKTKNIQMVSEWNYRYRSPSLYDSKIYEAAIDYNASTEYGIDVEYELYMFFRFMEKENGMSLIGDRSVAQL